MTQFFYKLKQVPLKKAIIQGHLRRKNCSFIKGAHLNMAEKPKYLRERWDRRPPSKLIRRGNECKSNRSCKCIRALVDRIAIVHLNHEMLYLSKLM